jgi:cytochrome c biogenesis protein
MFVSGLVVKVKLCSRQFSLFTKLENYYKLNTRFLTRENFYGDFFPLKKGVFKNAAALCSSPKVTLYLLLALAAVSVFGTLEGAAEQGRYDLYYQSLWYRLLLAALAVNLVSCTLKTFRRNFRDRSRFMAAMDEVSEVEADTVIERGRQSLFPQLESQGYRLYVSGDRCLAERGRLGRWGSTVVHCSCLLIMVGALASELGFVGTRFIYVGQQDNRVLDWKIQSERELRFTVRLDDFKAQYYPIDLQITAYRQESREPLQTWTTREGERFDLPGSGLSAEVVSFDPFTRELYLKILRDEAVLGDYRAGVGEHTYHEGFDAGVVLYPTAFRDPILKQTYSHVTILENGRTVRQGEISINHPLVHRGVSIYQTAFERDKFGFWYVGFQFSRDPGKPLVWAGCVTLTLGLLLAFGVPYRVVAISSAVESCRLRAIRGFGGVSGRLVFERLTAALKGG